MLFSGSTQPPSPHRVSLSWLNWHSPPTAAALARNQKDFIKETVTQATSSHYPQHLEKGASIPLLAALYMEPAYDLGCHEHLFLWFLALRRIDQTTHLAPSDVSLDNLTSPSKMFVTIKASKTDPFRSGVTLVLGAINGDLCPIGATLHYLSIRGTGNGPLFKFEDGSFLYRDRFVAEVRKLLRSAGIEASQYSGHSFRIGAATTAALAGVEDHTIQTMGRWHSSAYLLYIRLPPESLAGISGRLAAQS